MASMLTHCLIGLCVRVFVIIYGEIQDQMSLVPYTDIDYRVFTDAARHMLSGDSPYKRHTYRYTPLLAAMMIPNILLHSCWGKLLFSIIDIVVGILIRRLALSQGHTESVAVRCSTAWLYNPLAVVIATRGNADSISAALVFATLLLVQENRSTLLAGIVHGFAIHFRLYPIVFSLPLYLALRTPFVVEKSSAEASSLKRLCKFFWPNLNQCLLVFSCILTLLVLTFGFYAYYGFEFLHESLLYHLTRRDIRHNFSVYFYLVYLSSEIQSGIWQRVLTFLPQLVLLLAISLKYGKRKHLHFCFLAQSIVIVAYNPVLTSQYFVWFVSLIPPCLPHFNLSARQAGILSLLWFGAQLAWLLPAYWLEFRGLDTYIYIWLQGIAFFCANMALLARLVRAYQPLKIVCE